MLECFRILKPHPEGHGLLKYCAMSMISENVRMCSLHENLGKCLSTMKGLSEGDKSEISCKGDTINRLQVDK